MVKHLFKMVWNRKRWNALIFLEIFLSFAVLFVLAVMGLTFVYHARAPIGFDYKDVWVLHVSYPPNSGGENWQKTRKTLDAMGNYLDNTSEITAHGLINTPPYSNYSWSSSLEVEGRKVRTFFSHTHIGVLEAMDLEIVEGRWLEPNDEIREDVIPIVVDSGFARDAYPGETAAGKRFVDDEETYEILGVVAAFRKNGELRKHRNFTFRPMGKEVSWAPGFWLLEVPGGKNTALEEKIVNDLESMGPGYAFKIETMVDQREAYFAKQTQNLKIVSLIAFFMLAMVALGLLGVLWQHVTRRTVELGVRRAKGATRKKIYTQITGELLVVATLALVLGLVILLQVPVIGMPFQLPTPVLVSGFITAAIAIYLLTTAASLYPGWLATQTPPADALHYE